MNFAPVDWLIIIVYLALSMGAGLYGKRFISGISDFLVAGRSLGLYIGVSTLAATEIGTITFMYNAELGYKTGFSSFVIGLISGAVMVLIGQTGLVISRMREMRLMTVPEYFEAKYSRKLRVLTGVLVAIGGILNMGVFLKIEGTFLAILAGIPLEHVAWVMTVILLLEVIYTVLGGMVSVVITDFIQFLALGAATIVVTALSVSKAGVEGMREAVGRAMGPAGFDPIANPAYGWSFIIFQCLLWLAVDTCWQTTAMRTFSTKDSATSRKVFSWTGVIFFGRGMMPMIWGIAALTLLGPNQDSLQAMPRMLTDILPTGLRGLVAAGMLAATMSVNSSYLLGWSSVIAQDIVLPLRRTPLNSSQQVVLNRAANLFVSLFVMFWGLWYSLPGPAYFYLSMTATIFLAGSFSAIVGGLYWPRANAAGAYCAMISGAVSTVGFFVLNWPANYAGLGSFTCAAAGMWIGSLAGRQKIAHVPPAPVPD
jgi:solute:Na+ symporter, SSS family